MAFPASSLFQSLPPPLFPHHSFFQFRLNHLRLKTLHRTSSSSKSRRSGVIDFVDPYGQDDDDDEDNGVEKEDRSVDLLFRFLESVFKKVSRRARKAVRSVLPVVVSTKLVRFAVDGGLILAFLWVFKAFLQVVCTLGSVYFVSILLIRGIWSGIAYFQETRSFHLNQVDNNSPSWIHAHPAS